VLSAQSPVNPHERTIFIKKLQVVGQATRPPVIIEHLFHLHPYAVGVVAIIIVPLAQNFARSGVYGGIAKLT
jgi:hypothetical protein